MMDWNEVQEELNRKVDKLFYEIYFTYKRKGQIKRPAYDLQFVFSDKKACIRVYVKAKRKLIYLLDRKVGKGYETIDVYKVLRGQLYDGDLDLLLQDLRILI